MFSGRGQPDCEQLIDRYRIACAARCATCWSTTCANASRRWTSPPCRTWPTCSASCFGPIWRPTTPASTRCSCPATSPRPGSSACSPARRSPRAGARSAGRGWTGAACSPPCGPSTSIWPSGPTTTRPAGGRGRCAVRSAPATLAQEGPLTPQVPHGCPHPRTAAGAADPGRLGGGRTSPHRRAARRRRADPARPVVHRRRGRPCAGRC